MNGVKIAGVGKAIPDFSLTNDEISKIVDTSDEWIQTRTGIQSRNISQNETVAQLAARAGHEALKESGIMPEDIELVVVATVSPDTTMPSTACKVAKSLGITKAVSFDISAACSGFIYASEIAYRFILSGAYKNALVIGAEVFSKVLDWEDRGTCVLFGDGSGAVVYTQSEVNKILAVSTHTDPTGADLLTLPVGERNHTFYKVEDKKPYISMDGRAIYSFSVSKVPENIRETLEKADLLPEQIDYYILHQANARIMDSVAKKLKVDNNKFFKNIMTHGNTSAASIPMALCDIKDQLKTGDKLVLTGFGAGLTYGTLVVEW